MIRIAVLMTCHNRCATTIRCLEQLETSKSQFRGHVDVFLVDDGSTDGTSSQVSKLFPEVTLIKGSGDLFWCGGMRRAWQTARSQETPYDFFLWLNDDTLVTPTCIESLVASYARQPELTIVVGTCHDPLTRNVTYGGRSSTSNIFQLTLVRPHAIQDLPASTFNGNLVLIHRSVVDRVGILSPCYRHSLGDIDYGLRAKQAGVTIVIAPGYQATCPRNPRPPEWMLPENSLTTRLRLLQGPKGMPFSEWRHFVFTHSGTVAGLRYLFKPLIGAIFPKAAQERIRRRRALQ